MHSAKDEHILIIDFGSQYTKLIARKCRELGVFSRIIAYDEAFDVGAPRGIIMSGGPDSIHRIHADVSYLDTAPCPILGICLGMHAMIQHYGGKIHSASQGEYGKTEIHIQEEGLFPTNVDSLSVWMSHGDSVHTLPPRFTALAHSDKAVIAAVMDDTSTRFGLQFHPEVMHTAGGKEILQRFVHSICQCTAQWRLAAVQDMLIADIKHTLGSDHVILGISGGVDSSVVAALLSLAVPHQVHGIFVDTGLLRKDEAQAVMQSLSALDIHIQHVDAKKKFLRALRKVKDPNRKRKIIGHLFIRIFLKEAKKFPQVSWLAQGTIYPDVIESSHKAASKAHSIKLHHNVGGLPTRMPLRLIEPLRELFKDEVRNLGIALGLPAQLIQRHPFPGPGLAVRIIGEITASYIRILQEADAIFTEELIKHKLYHETDQAFAVFLPLKSVGVTGDSRRYGYTIALRAVHTKDYMTAQWASLPTDFLEQLSSRITNEIPEIGRIVYDISSKPPATIEWE